MQRREFLGLTALLTTLSGGTYAAEQPLHTTCLEEEVFDQYVQHVVDYINLQNGGGDEHFMRVFEEGLEVPEQGADDFRRMIMTYFGSLYYKHKPLRWDSNPAIKKGIRIFLKEHPSGRL